MTETTARKMDILIKKGRAAFPGGDEDTAEMLQTTTEQLQEILAGRADLTARQEAVIKFVFDGTASLKERRQALGLTQAELAEKMEVSDKSIRRWEQHGIDGVGAATVAKLAEALGTTLTKLIDTAHLAQQR